MKIEFEGFKFNKKLPVYQSKIEHINDNCLKYFERRLGHILTFALEVSDFVKVRKIPEEVTDTHGNRPS